MLYNKVKRILRSIIETNNAIIESNKSIIESNNAIIESNNAINNLKELFVQNEIDRIKDSPRHKKPKPLGSYGSKIYSQNDEDGIISEIFSRIGTTNNTFVEFGIGNGLENNTIALLFDNWNGLWIDASTRSVEDINKNLNKIIKSGKLKVIESFITKNNINELISNNIDSTEIDLLSVDLDGNDYHVLNAITCISPRVIVIEYNAKFTPPTSFCMDYDESHTWKGDDCFGASLKFLEKNIDGYCLVGCNLNGVNAFFVRQDLVGDNFLNPFTAENHYEPARYYLSGFPSGHPAAYSTLEKSLTMRFT